MADFTEISDLRQLRQQAKKLARRAEGTRHGYFSSDLDEGLDEAYRALRKRSDNPTVEITEHLTLFLRSLFANNHELIWVGDGTGHTDVEKSDVIIEHVFAKRRRDQDLYKPTIIVRPGPSNNSRLFIGDLKHFDWADGTETYTGLKPGTLQILVKATLPAAAALLADFISKSIEIHRSEIRHRVLHEIENVTTGGYEEDNPAYNQEINERRHVVIPITMTYYYQWTARKGPRPGVYEEGTSMVVALRRKEGIDAKPDVDERVSAEVKLTGDEILFAIPDEDEELT